MSKSNTGLDDSKPVPKKVIKFSYFEPIAGIIFALVASIIFLRFPQIITIGFFDTRLVPTFDEVVIRSLWIPIILWALVRIGVEVVYLIERRYSKRLALISVIGHALAAICTLIIFISPRIVYWEYIVWVDALFESVDSATWFQTILRNPHLVVLSVLIIVYVLESVTVVRRGYKAQKGTKKKIADEEEVVEENANEVNQ